MKQIILFKMALHSHYLAVHVEKLLDNDSRTAHTFQQ